MMKDKAIDLFCRGKKEEALELFTALISEGVEDADVYCHAAIVLESKGNCSKAVEYYVKALEINPQLVPALANLGSQLNNLGHLSTAAENLKKASELNAENSLIHSNYANVLTSMGEHKKAQEAYLKALTLKAGNLTALSSWLLSMNYTEKYTLDEIYNFHCSFSNAIGEIESELPGYNHEKLRIAYVSADFKRHSVAYFIEGILHFHDREKFDIYCYSDVVKPDAITEKIKKMDLTYRNIRVLTDEQVHKLALEDEIDILVDLAGHTGKRMRVFSYRSAPCQITYLGYGNTTGLKNMDLRIVDQITDLPDSKASEGLVRLDRPFLAFCPPDETPEIIDSPCIKNGYVTFGSFNNLPKLTDEVFRLWLRILKQVEHSRLMLKTRAFIDENIKNSVIERFESRGVSRERLELIGYQTTLDEHLTNYRKIDIALDPFPYNGTTTTCEALHMGVPVICLEGKSHFSRVSSSLLKHCGLNTLLATNKSEYMAIATQLAANFELLNELHHKVRNCFHLSPVCDSKELTEKLEAVYTQYAKRPAEASLF